MLELFLSLSTCCTCKLLQILRLLYWSVDFQAYKVWTTDWVNYPCEWAGSAVWAISGASGRQEYDPMFWRYVRASQFEPSESFPVCIVIMQGSRMTLHSRTHLFHALRNLWSSCWPWYPVPKLCRQGRANRIRNKSGFQLWNVVILADRLVFNAKTHLLFALSCLGVPYSPCNLELKIWHQFAAR